MADANAPTEPTAAGAPARPRTREEADAARRRNRIAAWVPVAVLVLGLLPLLVYAVMESRSVVAAAMLTAGAANLAGALLGFLFGIPRSLTAENAPGDAAGGYRPNTNLEQISDWLTKILVGVGLVELGELRQNVADLVDFVSPSLGTTEHGFTLAVLVYFTTTGFLSGYVWTRLWLPGAFAWADRDARLAALVTDVVAEREERGVNTIGRVKEQLDVDEPPVPQDELNRLLADAPRGIRVQAFDLARDQRLESWRSEKERVARTIPVFRALIASDAEQRYHRAHGELGFALKDQPRPDWAGAEQALTTAIERRDRPGSYPSYEFNRAVCRIQLDPDFDNDRPSSPENRDRILADLDAGARLAWVRRLIAGGRAATPEVADVQNWLQLNGIDATRFAR